MKKLLAMLLALVMTLSLVACGSKNPGNDPGNPDEEVITISIANYDQPNSFTVACIEEFIKYAEEHSNGTLKFKTTYGAALCSMPEEYEYMKAGAVDMIAMIPPFCMSELPYIYGEQFKARCSGFVPCLGYQPPHIFGLGFGRTPLPDTHSNCSAVQDVS